MKNKKHILLVTILILLIFLVTGCSGFFPKPTKGVISGRVLMPPAAKQLSKDISGWVPAAGAEVTIVDANGVKHTVITDENGYYSFENIAVKANTVVTATVKVDGKIVVLKDVIPQSVEEDEDYNTGTMTPESTALALVVEKLITEGKEQTDIALEEIQGTKSFAALVEQVETVIEEQGNVTEVPDVTEAVEDTAEEAITPPAPPAPTPPEGTTTIPVSGVSVTPVEMYLEMGKTATITVTVLPPNATNKEVIWSSSNEGVATVINGVITPVAVGEATITAKTVNRGLTATCKVTVINLISDNADVEKEDFSVMSNPISKVIGYNVGFAIKNTKAPDVKKIVVVLYDSDKVLATNTSAGILEQYTDATSLSAPFDVFGDFNYVADGCWDYSGWLGDISDIPTEAEIIVTFKNGVVKTATNNTLTGDTGIFTKNVINMTKTTAYDTIQTAIGAASENDTILVGPGEYEEQIKVDKSIVLVGADANSTTINMPSAPTADDRGRYNVVTITGSNVYVEFTGFKVSGIGSGNCNSIHAGLTVEGSAYAYIHHNSFQDLHDTPFSGCQNGWGITVGGDPNIEEPRPATAKIENNSFKDFQKGGITVAGTDSSATITDNTITGVGNIQNVIGQDGIRVTNGATAIIETNIISEMRSGSWMGTGILIDNGVTDVLVSGNTVSGNGVGIFIAGPVYAGSGITTGTQIIANTFTDQGTGIVVGGNTDDTEIFGNTISNNGDGIRLEQTSDGFSLPTNVSIENNDITDNSWVDQQAAIHVLAAAESAGAYHNRITGSTNFGVNNESGISFDATYNWWGDASGPQYATLNPDGLGDAISDNVTYNPWCVNAECTE